jgi:hypothetical protein
MGSDPNTAKGNDGCDNCDGLTSLQSVRGCVLQSTDGTRVSKFYILQFSKV